MEYQIVARGEVMDTMDDKATALMAVRAYPAEWYPQVIAHEVSGTYESHTCVWPERGETYSN